MFKGQNDKVCMAKTAFMYSLGVCLVKILLSGITVGDIEFEQVDLVGLAAFLTPIGAVYWGRSETKAKTNV